jgi:hypothetical protein
MTLSPIRRQGNRASIKMRADPLIPQEPLVSTKQLSNRIALEYADADPTLATKASVNAVPQLTATQTWSTLTL